MGKYGYCCINLSLQEGKKNFWVTTNRSMTKKTFTERGLPYVSELALKNVSDLNSIIDWNFENRIQMYRMSSDMFPWCSEYELEELPDFPQIKSFLESAGDKAKRFGQRITFHPSPYGVLASINPEVVTKALKELRQHAEIMDLMGLERSHNYPINIHVNTTKPTKEEAAERFCQNFYLLPENVRKRLVVEVDDKTSQYTSVDLKLLIYDKIGIPITFDYLHNFCNPPEFMSEKDSLEICLKTWGEITPLTHYSESKKIFECETSKLLAHTDWIHSKIETYGFDFDIELEVKMKDKALLDYNQKIERILLS
jgi:UV DNA damage endonuclease